MNDEILSKPTYFDGVIVRRFTALLTLAADTETVIKM
jgi:hypothetical protein